jgi:hypothetical protein
MTTLRFHRLPRLSAALVALMLVGGVQAKLPAPTDEQKAKATEAAAKAAEAAKKQAQLLGASQDRVAQHYAARLKAEGKPFNPTPIAAPAAPAAPAAAAAPAVAAGASKAPATKP